MSLLVLATGCGGPQNTPAPAAAKPRFETRWLRGISATEVKAIAQGRGLGCQGPTLESGTNVWRCTARTPLVDYRVQFYGSAPLKLEYITATVTQAGSNAKPEMVRPLFLALAGLHYDGGDPMRAREWVVSTIETPGGGQTTIGPARFKVSGDLLKMTLDMKASGSDW
jgi:hypothetical protein